MYKAKISKFTVTQVSCHVSIYLRVKSTGTPKDRYLASYEYLDQTGYLQRGWSHILLSSFSLKTHTHFECPIMEPQIIECKTIWTDLKRYFISICYNSYDSNLFLPLLCNLLFIFMSKQFMLLKRYRSCHLIFHTLYICSVWQIYVPMLCYKGMINWSYNRYIKGRPGHVFDVYTCIKMPNNN